MQAYASLLNSRRFRGFAWAGLCAYFILIVYGSLYPFNEWRMPEGPLFGFLTLEKPKYVSMSDVWLNVAVYIPFSLLLTRLIQRGKSFTQAIFISVLVGGSLSFLMETLQMFLPGRVSSILDIALNTSGSLMGGLLAWVFHPRTWLRGKLSEFHKAWFLPGTLTQVSLLALGFAMLAGLGPLLPSPHGPGALKSVMPLWQALVDTTRAPWLEGGAYGASILGLGLFASLLVHSGRPNLRPFYFFLGLLFAIKFASAVLLSSIPFVQWRFSARAIIGLAIGLPLLWYFATASRKLRIGVAGVSLLVAVLVEALLPGDEGTSPSPFNWVPFFGHMYGFSGLFDMLSTPAPFIVLGLLASFATPYYRRTNIAVGGGLAVFALSFTLELAQQSIPGHSADITDVLLAVTGWISVWHWRPSEPQAAKLPTDPNHVPQTSLRLRHVLIFFILLAIGLPVATMVVEMPVSDKYLPKLPSPESLPPVDLPHFHIEHPRLPAPSAAEILRLHLENPEYLKRQASFAHNHFWPAIFLARAEPGSQDLTELHRRLMSIKFIARGDDQAKVLAVAYDWLYDQWSEQQRRDLRVKLAEGCDYVIQFIRKQRLSPYNVYLYNSPFQGLMAMSIALYKDHPEGELAMRFTQDLWKTRTLPVWRQIMGNNGGWHEGGEYIALGIGQAVYELPAMWRSATGEDYIASEPGIRGFVNFVLYRMRPDGSHFRIGDASFAERIPEDVTPLALELRDAAAYALRKPSQKPEPTAWPWGPLTDPSLDNPLAIQSRPLSMLMDGVGIVVSRSSWGPDATYVTFKAGDNFWSHSHLDQGSFTIFKGAPLAIDSGLYPSDYGNDHHMNYTYQTIAHNTVTVTDPADTVPELTKRGKRYIANDGGQRRIGSGWGIEPAPMDREEWEEKRDIYHTGEIKKYQDKDGITAVTADITPAYTNAMSGQGTFSHRTRRVEKFIRTFGYDRIDDVVVVFDRVQATKPEFKKRWLLHSIDRPDIEGNKFTIVGPASSQLHRIGGILTGIVLLPEHKTVSAIGGKGMEFFVDGRNYDENGKIYQSSHFKNDPDVGAWRIEVSPEKAAREDIFLTVLLPTLNGPPPHKVRLIRSGNEVGCEVRGPNRTVQWWFDPSGQLRTVLAPTPAS